MFNTAFDEIGAKPGDFYPQELRTEIDELNSWIYDTVNNGVYKAGFATAQDAYDEAVSAVFTSLDKLESILSHQRYLTGTRLTEADLRLWTTLVVLIRSMSPTLNVIGSASAIIQTYTVSCAIFIRYRE